MKRIFLLLSAAALIARGQQDDRLAQAINETVETWVERTKVDVTPEARRLMSNNVQAQRRVLLDIEAASGVKEQYEATRMLLRHYCFDLRDKKFGRQPRARAQAIPPAFGFQPAAATMSLTARDVQRVTFRDFLERLFEGLKPRPVGYLEVTSTPERADIAINRDRKGYTNRVFVLTTGLHVVEIKRPGGRSCSQRITIQPAQTLLLACD